MFEILKMVLGNNFQQQNMRLSKELTPTPAQNFAASQPGVFQPGQLEQILGLPANSIDPELLARTLRTDPMALMNLINTMNQPGAGLNIPQR